MESRAVEIMERLHKEDRDRYRRSLPKVYLLWTEGKTDFAVCETWLGSRFMAIWIGLATWVRLDPQRVCIGEMVRTEFEGKRWPPTS